VWCYYEEYKTINLKLILTLITILFFITVTICVEGNKLTLNNDVKVKGAVKKLPQGYLMLSCCQHMFRTTTILQK
jgi:hypothetical protein